jgi:outer membrane protein assembly factor BamE (lipoprotein component of BamABCDE complex)
MKKLNFFLLAAALLGLGACATVGNEFPSDFASKLVVGKTTRAEVEKQLGQPYRTGLDSGDPTSSYMYYRLGLFVDTVTKDLTVRFDGHGLVKSYTYNANTPAPAEKVDYNAR